MQRALHYCVINACKSLQNRHAVEKRETSHSSIENQRQIYVKNDKFLLFMNFEMEQGQKGHSFILVIVNIH